jgi:hypothetical protein
LDSLDQLAHKDHEVQMEHKELQDRLDPVGHLERRVLKDLRVFQDL